jgi:hypothetical protein
VLSPLSVRAYSLSAFVPAHNAILCWGGIDITNVLNNNLFALTADTAEWRNISSQQTGAIPPPLWGMSAVTLSYSSGDVQLMFGGVLDEMGAVVTNSLYLFNTTSLQWSLLTPTAGAAPSARCFCAVVLKEAYGGSTVMESETVQVFVFGGWNGSFDYS